MQSGNILTQDGYNKLKEELNYLKKVARVEVAEKIREAREIGGDYNENTLYDNTLAEQGFIEGRISEVEKILVTSEIANIENSDGSIHIGNAVTVEFAGKTDEFIIVGSAEADPSKKCISSESPVGMALLGAKKGDVVEVKTPLIVAVYKVVKVK